MTSSRPSAHERLGHLFGEPAGPEPAAPRRRRRATAIAVVIVVVVGAAVITVARNSGPTYRTAVVAPRTVASELTTVGTIEPVSQAAVAFPVSGTVATVAVKQGDTVDAGQTLATLDADSLEQSLHSKQAALAQAQLTLTRALSGQSTGTTGSSGAFAQNARAGTDTTIILATATPPDPQLAAAQQAVIDAQKKVDAALTAADNALADVDSACADTTTSTTSTTTTTTPQPNPAAACVQALNAASAAQHTLAKAQQQLADATTALDDLLTQRASSTPPATGGTDNAGSGTQVPSESPATGGTGGSSSSGGLSGGTSNRSSTSSTPSAADIAAYQKAVDAAESAVAVAQQAVAQSSISSPIPGTVVAVNVAPGQSVSAGSTSANVIVEGAGGFEVSTSIGIDAIPQVKVGQSAQVTPDGARRARTAKVSSIGVAPDPSSTTVTRYVVFLALDNPNAKLNNGSTATVSIVTGDAKGGLAVPTSAVTTNGSRHTVQVLRGGTPTTKRIRIGVSGPIWTEVRSGLRRGDEVVVADLSEALPSSATSSTNGNQNQTITINGPAFPGGFAGGFNRNR